MFSLIKLTSPPQTLPASLIKNSKTEHRCAAQKPRPLALSKFACGSINNITDHSRAPSAFLYLNFDWQHGPRHTPQHKTEQSGTPNTKTKTKHNQEPPEPLVLGDVTINKSPPSQRLNFVFVDTQTAKAPRQRKMSLNDFK